MVHCATCFFLSEMVNVLIYAGGLEPRWSGYKLLLEEALDRHADPFKNRRAAENFRRDAD